MSNKNYGRKVTKDDLKHREEEPGEITILWYGPNNNFVKFEKALSNAYK